ncbi:MAG: hypothetical protein ABUS79_25760, partial [Pseudomonadota bacterium]
MLRRAFFRRLPVRRTALPGAAAGVVAVLATLMPATCAVAAGRRGSATVGAETAGAAFRRGDYQAARRLGGGTGRRTGDASSIAAAARAEMALGRYEDADQRLRAAGDRAPADLRLRHALADVLAVRGDRAALRPIVDLTYDDWKAGRVDRKNADDLLAVAALLRLDDNWQDANDVLRTAVRADPRNPRPNVFWGYLFLEKHAIAEAEASFRAAVEVDATNPDAHAGLAAVHLQKHYDVAAADEEIDAALRVNPRHAGALALRAEMALDGEDFDTVAALIIRLRETNPRDPGAGWLAAARARLLDDTPGYERERDAHAALHPADGDFFAAVAEMLIRHRRTEDARIIAEEGAAAEPTNGRCLSALATTRLRLGEEASGVEALRRAWKRDPYDARTYNLLELFDKVVPRMETFATRHLTFRIDPAARPAVERVVAPFLEETYARYVARYAIEPKGPITFELYTDPRHFAVRTVGLPGIGVDAVCFGRVITSQSPANGVLNWGMVLAHELAHVFAIELSRSRVPRWFTEGLSELETMRARAEWRRHADRELWGAAWRGDLSTLSSLSNAFVRARSSEEATRAYAEAAAALDYLDRTFGFPRIRDALIAFGRGRRGLEVVAAATGVSVDALETGFRADLAARTAAFDRQYLPGETLRPPGGPRGAGAPPAVPGVRADFEARQGLAALRAGDTGAAARALDRARAIPTGANRRAVAFLEGELALARRRADEAHAAFSKLLTADAQAGESPATGDGY